MVSLQTVLSPTSNTKRQDTFNNRLVEKGNECSIYSRLLISRCQREIKINIDLSIIHQKKKKIRGITMSVNYIMISPDGPKNWQRQANISL